MAKGTRGHRPHKKTQAPFARSGFGKAVRSAVGRVFCKRSIIIISNHKTQHIPFTAGKQLAALLVLVALVAWGGYSSGSYVTTQQVLAEKDRKLMSSARENKRIASEFELLKSDLTKLVSTDKSGKAADYAKMIAQHTADSPASTDAAAAAEAVTGPSAQVSPQYEAVFRRVEYLDNKVKELQANHDEMIADIRATTGGKIRELEKVIAKTGVAEQPLEKAAEAKRSQDEQRREKYGRTEAIGKNMPGGQGGPFEPAHTSTLKERETELYFNLRRMMVLNDIVNAMPLASPLPDTHYVQTSGFGNRIDPFGGDHGFHSGLDLAGPEHAKVHVTNDGQVEFAGWKSDYGNVIDVKHAYGLSTRYAHLERILVQPDQIVKKGQIIGIQGSTGRSTGHHLHYEVRYEGRAINPATFLKAGEDVQAVN